MSASDRYSSVPASQLAKKITEYVRDTESEPFFNHSTRVLLWAALTGQRKGLTFDRELVYAGAMFDDIGLTERYLQSQLRFEVDSANAARDFKNNIIQAFYDGMKHRPDSTVGTVNDDVLALKDPKFTRADFCSIILGSAWPSGAHKH